MLSRVGLALLVTTSLFSSQVFAGDDFVISNAPNNHMIMVGEAPPQVEKDIGGDSATAEPGTNNQQQAAQAPQAPQVRQHPKPELPAGWSSPDEVTIDSGQNYGNSYGTGIGTLSNNAMGILPQLLQTSNSNITPGYNAHMTGSQFMGGLAGNAAIRNNQPTLPSGFVSPHAASGLGGGGLNGFPAIPSQIMNQGLAGMAAGEDGSYGEGPQTPQERAMMAAFLSSLLQYVQSQPDNNFAYSVPASANYAGGGASIRSASSFTPARGAVTPARGVGTSAGNRTATPARGTGGTLAIGIR